MSNLATQYLGLTLRNPILVGASSLTLNAKAVERCADAGAGAVVLKSLFEEQIRMETRALSDSLQAGEQWHSEVFEYMEADIGMRYGTRDYLQVIKTSKQAVGIPVIASINCISAEWWIDFAAEVEAAGADALELNVAIVPTAFDVTAQAVEEAYFEIARRACETVSIPVAIKLPPFCSALPSLVLRLRREGIRGVVLFNRFYHPTIDVGRMRITVESQLSMPGELCDTLRWISLLAGKADVDLAATRGVHCGGDAAKAILAGANVAQSVSTFYRNGVEYIRTMLDELSAWMEQHEFETLAAFRGKLSQKQHPEGELFGRFQYIKGLVGIE